MSTSTTLSYNLPPTATETAVAKKNAKRDNLFFWGLPLAALIMVGLVGWAYGAIHAANIPRLPTRSQLSSYVAQANKDLAWCASAETRVTPLLHTLLAGSSTPASRLALSVAATQGEGHCTQGTNGETALGYIGPEKGYLGFNGFYWDADIWQTNDNAAVLSDIARLSNNPTSTKYLSALILAADAADSDVRAMTSTVTHEAGYIHMKNVPTTKVPTWNLTPNSALALAPK